MTLRHAFYLSFAASIYWMTACTPSIPEDQLAARVDGTPITKTDLNLMMTRSLARYRTKGHENLPPGIEVRIKQSVLRQMIDDKVIESAAKKLDVVVTDAQLEKKFTEHKNHFRTNDAFEDYLKRSGNTVQNMRNDLRRNMLRDKVIQQQSHAVEVTDADIAKYYNDNIKRFVQKEQVKVSRIVIQVPADASKKAWRTAEKKAKALFKQATQPGIDFGAIAAAESDGPEKIRRGDLGFVPRGRLDPAMDAKAFALQPATIAAPIKTRLGWEIIKVFEHRQAKEQPLEAVKNNISNSLLARRRNEQRHAVLRDLRAKAKIEELVTFDQQKKQPNKTPSQ